MIEVAICDDVKEDAEKLKDCLQENFLGISTEIFTDELKFLDSEKEFDVIFLDFSMPKLSGEELALKLREKGTGSLLVFFTGSQEPTPGIFRVEPFRYLLKDMGQDKLIRELEEIIHKCHERRASKYIYAKRKGDIIRVPIYDISYIELAKHGCVVHTVCKGESGEYFLKKNIREIDRELESSGFARAHNSYLISMEHVVSYNKSYVQMDDNVELNVSRSYRKSFDMAFRKFILKRN
ncbi:MAG: response regulator transcription factor [Lachnospiraceae bacterium]|nr:response regulator transcription factor [Lachnospiraceae bacterium]